MSRASESNGLVAPRSRTSSCADKTADTVNRDLEIRDLYNAEDAFALKPDYVGAYRARFNSNLAFYDGLDGKTDWPLDAGANHPLTELLLADFLVVDLSKPFKPRAAMPRSSKRCCAARSTRAAVGDG